MTVAQFIFGLIVLVLGVFAVGIAAIVIMSRDRKRSRYIGFD